MVTWVDLAGSCDLVQAEGNGTSGRVAVLVYVDVDLLVGKTDLLLGGLNDPDIRLVTDELGNVVNTEAGRFEGVFDDFLEFLDGELVDLSPIHAEVSQAYFRRRCIRGDVFLPAGHV